MSFHFNFLLRHKGLGTKRLASEEFVNDWDNKRLNIGHVRILPLLLFKIICLDGAITCRPSLLFSYLFPLDLQTNGPQPSSYQGFEHPIGTIADSNPGAYTSFSNAGSGVAPSLQVPMLLPQHATTPTLLGKG